MRAKPTLPAASSFGLPKAGVRYIKKARANATKQLKSSPGVAMVRFPSLKNGVVIQCGSRTGEFPAYTGMEGNSDVTEYHDQPPKLKIIYDSKSGRRTSVRTTPDVCKHRRSMGWVIGEIKHRASIEKEAEKFPNRYCKDENGTWTCPPGIEAAAKLGMQFVMIIPDEKDDIQHRNYNWLEDYFLEDIPKDLDEQLDTVRTWVCEHDGRVRLSDLIDKAEDSALVYRAIALNAVYFDARRDLICRPTQAWVYTDEDTAVAWGHVDGLPRVLTHGVEFYEGNRLRWDNDTWTIRKVTKNDCVLQSSASEVISMAGPQLLAMIDDGRIQALPNDRRNDRAYEILRQASPADLAEANENMKLLHLFRSKDHTATQFNSARTYRRWNKNFRIAERDYGCGYLGLIPGHSRKGNRTSRLEDVDNAMIEKSLIEDDRSIADMGIYPAYALYTARCDEAELEPVCYETYLSHALKCGVVERVESKRGKRASYKYKGPLKPASIPTHGDRPWEVAHADHTLSEIVLKSKLTGEVLGRAWMTLLIDGHTNEPLARYYTFAPPSRVSLMMLLRDCVQRHNRLPQRIVVDQGSDFNSVYFEQTLAAFMVSKVERPSGESKFGSRGERVNSTIDTKLLGVLLGNTKNMKNVREVYRTHDPEQQAVWTPEEYIKLFDEFIFKIYPNLRGFGTHETPRDHFERLQQQAGSRPGRYIPYDELFHIMTMLEPAGRSKRFIHPFGISINHIRYWAPELQDYVGDKREYDVRFDPIDMSRAYIYLRGEWIELYTTSPIVREYMESGIDDGLVELMARALTTSREYRSVPIVYAKFLLAARRNEEFFIEQRSLTELDVENEEPPPDDESIDFFLPENPELFKAHQPQAGAQL